MAAEYAGLLLSLFVLAFGVEHTEVRCTEAEQLAYHERMSRGGLVGGVSRHKKARKFLLFRPPRFHACVCRERDTNNSVA